MENNKILNLVENKAMTAHEFKSAEIRDRVAELTARYSAYKSTAKNIGEEIDALRNEMYKELAPIVAKLSEMNAHKAEGFKTWSKFCDACLPINSRAAGTLITYYKKVQVVPELSDFTVSNVEAIAPADAEAIRKAIANKEITPETTQPKLKEFAKDHPRAVSGKGRPKIIPTFDIFYELANGEGLNETVIARNVIKYDIPYNMAIANQADIAAGAMPSIAYFSFKDPDGNVEIKCISVLHVDGTINTYRIRPHVKPKAEKPAPKKEVSVYDQLRAQFDFMADWTDEQIAATLRKNADKAKGK